MATGVWDGSVRVYEEDDKVDEKLLNQLSKWILYNRLPWRREAGMDLSVRVYEEDDKVDEKLLNQLSKWILYNRLPWLARNLGFTHDEIYTIM